MSVNLVPEDALPKSSYLESEVGRDRDSGGSEPYRSDAGKDHFAPAGQSSRELSLDETLPSDRR